MILHHTTVTTMGILNLSRLINKYSQDVPLAKLSGKTLGIDTSCFLHKTMRSDGSCPHIRQFLEMYVELKRNDIVAIFVFDGKPPKQKSEEISSRSDVKDRKFPNVRAAISKATGIDIDSPSKLYAVSRVNSNPTINKIMAKAGYVPPSYRSDLKTLFNLAGIKYVQALGEADIELARMYQDNVIDGVISEDTDMLTHGIGILIRGYRSITYYKTNCVKTYSLETILEQLQMTRLEFVEMCVLCGCDYTSSHRPVGIGPISALKLIKQFGSIDTFVESSEHRYKIPPGFITRYPFAVGLFMEPDDSQLAMEPPPIMSADPDPAKLRRLLQQKCGYRPATLDSTLSFLKEPCCIPSTLLRPSILDGPKVVLKPVESSKKLQLVIKPLPPHVPTIPMPPKVPQIPTISHNELLDD